MRLLLDTHIALWLMRDAVELNTAARRALQAADEIFVSSVSVWEVTIKAGLGKLPIDPVRFEAQLLLAGIQPLPVTWAHAVSLRDLPLHHRDPFDRMLIAQAKSEPLILLTHDTAFAAYGDSVMLV